jgi:hypothetical protein
MGISVFIGWLMSMALSFFDAAGAVARAIPLFAAGTKLRSPRVCAVAACEVMANGEMSASVRISLFIEPSPEPDRIRDAKYNPGIIQPEPPGDWSGRHLP